MGSLAAEELSQRKLRTFCEGFQLLQQHHTKRVRTAENGSRGTGEE